MKTAWITMILATSFVVLALLFAFVAMFRSAASRIPPNVQIQSSFTKDQAVRFYSRAHQDLWRRYWHGLGANIRSRQFRSAWADVVNGPGAIQGVVADVNSNIVSYVQNRNGEGFWITVSLH